MKPFSVRDRFYLTKDDTLAVSPAVRMADAIIRFFYALFLKVIFLLSALVLDLISFFFIDVNKERVMHNLRLQDIMQSLHHEENA